jgi:excisionase family DNA binding protein
MEAGVKQLEVYFACVVNTDLFKIGVSRSPRDRVEGFSPPCNLIYTVCVSAEAAWYIESQLLEHCSEYVLADSEWMQLPPDVANKLPDRMESLAERQNVQGELPIPRAGQRTFEVEEVAALLGRHRRSIYRMIEQDELGALKPGQSYTITRSHLREYVGDEEALEDLESAVDFDEA